MTPDNVGVHVEAEVTRGDDALRAAHALLDLGLRHDAVARAHYAALHFARALLLTEGVEPKTHAGVASMLSLHFVRSGRLSPDRAKDLSRLEQLRTEADYNRFFEFTAEGAAEEIAAADRFAAAARPLLAPPTDP